MVSNLAQNLENTGLELVQPSTDVSRSSGYFNMLDGVRRIQEAIGKPDKFTEVREYILRQDNSELGEAVLPNLVSRAEMIFDETNNIFSQGGFNMNEMIMNGVVTAQNFKGEEEFEKNRRTAEGENYFGKVIPNAKRIINGETQIIEVSPAPHPTDVDPMVARRFGYDSEKGGEGIGVIRLYRQSSVNKDGVEIVQIKIPTAYKGCEQLLKKLGLANDSDFEQTKTRDGSEILEKAGEISTNLDIYSILKMYFEYQGESSETYDQMREDMEDFYKRIEPIRMAKMNDLFNYQVQMAWRLLSEPHLEKEAERDLTLEKIRVWREFASELNQKADLIIEMEKNGILAPVTLKSDDKILICGTEIAASIGELLDKGARMIKILGLNFTEDDKGSLAFTCNSCNAVNLRSALTGDLLPACTFCGSKGVSCDADQTSYVFTKSKLDGDSKK